MKSKHIFLMCILSLVAYNSSAQTLEFTKEGAVAEEQFGSATKISGNGQFLVVGSPQYKPDKFGVKGKISIYKKTMTAIGSKRKKL